MSSRPSFLVSNDDGVHAPGLKALAEMLKSFGDVTIVAPHVERSATSHAITIALPLRVERIHDNTYAVEGSPADCVMVAFWKILKRPPDWVITGINRGGNLGIDTLYSGTVGAAMEGALHGVRAIAVSSQGERPLRYDTAAAVTRTLIEHEAKWSAAIKGKVLNVNVPSVPLNELKGLAFTSLGRRVYDQNLVEGVDPRGRAYFWIGGGGDSHMDIEGSDCNLFDEGYATASVLKPELFDESATSALKLKMSGGLNELFRF